MTTFQFVVLSLAVWRMSSLLVHEDGPKGLFRWCRRVCEGNELFWQLLQCVWCTSVWIAAIVLLGWWLIPTVTWWVSLWLAMSALAVAFQQICRNDIGNELLTLAKRWEGHTTALANERDRAIAATHDLANRLAASEKERR